MNTQQKCPHCGSPADEVGSHAKTVDLTEISFRCRNKSCGSAFTGVFTLARSGTPGAQNFNRESGRADNPGESVTDC